MAATVPAPISLRLEQALGQWRHWRLAAPLPEPPTVLHPLGRGLSNHSFLLASGEQRFVLRLDGINPAANGLSRQLEWRILQRAHAAGIAPAPRYCNPELGALVCDYLAIEGSNPDEPTAVALLLQRIHALPAVHTRLDLGERCRRSEHSLRNARPENWQALQGVAARIAGLLPQLAANSGPLTLCHNDLLRSNRLQHGDRLWAVDWEYAAMGSVWFDLAAVTAGDEWPAAAIAALLGAYLGRALQPAEQTRFLGFECAYRYLELLWYLLAPEPPPADYLTRKRTTLESRLAALPGG
ncbi:choline/ethanolamine kinase family protein [Haliea sp. E1-2-M8]|uniref:choline/ethanolamine kinase family protein n=1 Tax=Haliea sp. E1-2-M8 TaxID=3064706 RepID=UPI0027198324|nr:choline/ethanolamine kinase family protein [Haliea sp. E1-2-M8]MDO8861428.1 choline/ethanolamine kinase family protein [Haliea sp. E1-2-M8]